MSPVEQSLVERKLTQIAERLQRLEPYAREGWEKYKANFERRKTTEKLLQEIIEAAIDINTHVLVEIGGSVPQDYTTSFLKLGELGWLSAELTMKLAPSAGLRNRLVHQYAAIDDRKVFEAISSVLTLFRQYITSIRDHLGR